MTVCTEIAPSPASVMLILHKEVIFVASLGEASERVQSTCGIAPSISDMVRKQLYKKICQEWMSDVTCST